MSLISNLVPNAIVSIGRESPPGPTIDLTDSGDEDFSAHGQAGSPKPEFSGRP